MDHITNYTHKLFHIPLVLKKKGDHAQKILRSVVGQENILINKPLKLQNTLHVPKLFTYLLSIQKLTNESQCNVLFYLHIVQLKKQETMRAIRLC